MLNKILTALHDAGVENYLIEQQMTETVELFFIKKKLDMRRAKDEMLATVTVYRDFESDGAAMRGASDALISPDMDETEIVLALRDAYAAAGHVKNPAFQLYEGRTEPEQVIPSALAAHSLAEDAAAMAEALFRPDTRPDAFLNSAEIFAERRQVRIVSSAGTDVGYVKHRCQGEFVVQCLQPKDVEQYFHFDYDDLDTAALEQKAAAALNTVCDRAKAEKSPAGGEYDIVLSGENVKTVLEFYLRRANASMVYAKYSDYAPGAAVQGEKVHGEKLNITAEPDAPYSAEGIPMAERSFITDGKLQFLHGATRFCRYLGIEPTGNYRRFRVENGAVPFDELKRGCLYPVSFSDFQMDASTGRFGGEIRLAYLFTDTGVEILTGGSINGSLLEKQDDLTFSAERYTEADYEGPFAVKFKAVAVAGC